MTWLLSLLSGGLLDRIFNIIDKKMEVETDREKLKADIIREHYRTRTDWMRAGGVWLMWAFAGPLAAWFVMVVYDSTFGCLDCLFPNTWTVAALPPPLDEWAGLIIMAIFGVLGVQRFRR